MFKKQLKLYRKNRGFTQEKLAKAIGIAKSTISMYESGKREPDFETMEAIADVLNVSIGLLMDSESPSTGSLSVPVFREIPVKKALTFQGDIIGYETLTGQEDDAQSFFAVHIDDESMEPRIAKGDMLIIKKQSDVESGQLAVVLLGDSEVVIRKLVKYENSIALFAFNPSCEPLFFTNEQLLSLPVTVIGRVIESRSRY